MTRSSDGRVLLTGASGFIGSRVYGFLTRRGYKVRTLTCRRTTPSKDALLGDLDDISVCTKAMRNIDIVIHAAGEKRDRKRLWGVNVRGTHNLLVAALDQGVKQFVHLSSVGVVGANPFQSRVFNEDSPCYPGTPYQRSKWRAEELAYEARGKGLKVVILRPANVFGENDPEKALLRLARCVRQHRFIFLGGRDVICNYVFVDDLAYAICALAESSSPVDGTYNIADTCRLVEFVESMADELGVARPSLRIPDSLAAIIRRALHGIRQLPLLSQSSALCGLTMLNNQAIFATPRIFEALKNAYPVGWREGLKRVLRWYRLHGEL